VHRTLASLVAFFGALTILGFLGRFWWPFELISFFRPWQALFLLVFAAVALPLRFYAAALAALALAAGNVAVVAEAVRERPSFPPAAAGTTVKLLFLNVFAENDDYDRVADLIREERPAVVGLTELTPAWARALRPTLARYPASASAPREGFFGIGVWGQSPLRRPRIEPFAEGGRNAVLATLALGPYRATLVVVHPPFPFTPAGARDRRRQLDAIGAAVDRGQLGRRVAVCGDLNATPWSATERRLVFRGLTDVSVGRGFAGTWPSFLPAFLRLPLDTCLVRGLTLVDRRLGPRVGSDHLPLVVELGVPSTG
jgi:endonuclease/exonuclease/phosphatase (EEP) superfamily protein YafD